MLALACAALLAYSPGGSRAAVQETPWADWECPGFPCFIVNYYAPTADRTRGIRFAPPCPHIACALTHFDPWPSQYNISKAGVTSYSQTCGPVQDMETCNDLEQGKSFDAKDGSGHVIGTHTLKKPHPCHSKNFGCIQSASPCVQGSVAACQGYCNDLKLVPHYQDICMDYCSVHCP